MTANELKNNYLKQCKKQRGNNFKYLRTVIAGENNLTKFSELIGIPATRVSELEHGDREPSQYHILSYRDYFYKQYNICVSVDYLYGFTDVIENKNANFADKIGLSGTSLEMLEMMNDKNNTLYYQNNKNLLMLNHILETFKNDPNFQYTNLYFTILRDMWDYINLIPENITYPTFNEKKELTYLKSIHVVDKERVTTESEGIEISPVINLGELYKVKLQKDLLEKLDGLAELLSYAEN